MGKWGKVFQVVRLVYRLFLKGRKVGGVTLPNERPTLPTPSQTLPLLSAAGVEAREPFPKRTLAALVALVFGVPVGVLVALGVIEWRTLGDDVPDNHITATLRRAHREHPGAVLLALVVWVAFLVAVAAGIAGHVFWS